MGFPLTVTAISHVLPLVRLPGTSFTRTFLVPLLNRNAYITVREGLRRSVVYCRSKSSAGELG